MTRFEFQVVVNGEARQRLYAEVSGVFATPGPGTIVAVTADVDTYVRSLLLSPAEGLAVVALWPVVCSAEKVDRLLADAAAAGWRAK